MDRSDPPSLGRLTRFGEWIISKWSRLDHGSIAWLVSERLYFAVKRSRDSDHPDLSLASRLGSLLSARFERGDSLSQRSSLLSARSLMDFLLNRKIPADQSFPLIQSFIRSLSPDFLHALSNPILAEFSSPYLSSPITLGDSPLAILSAMGDSPLAIIACAHGHPLCSSFLLDQGFPWAFASKDLSLDKSSPIFEISASHDLFFLSSMSSLSLPNAAASPWNASHERVLHRALLASFSAGVTLDSMSFSRPGYFNPIMPSGDGLFSWATLAMSFPTLTPLIDRAWQAHASAQERSDLERAMVSRPVMSSPRRI